MPTISRSLSLAFSTAAVFVLGCAAPSAPAGVEVRLASTELSRDASGWARVDYSVVNTGATAVAVTSRCGDRLSPAIERPVSGRWEPYAGGVCEANLEMAPVALPAGGRRDEAVNIADPGEFRLVVGTEHGPVRSPAFVIR